jgi:Domain of unknown function (DUF4145)
MSDFGDIRIPLHVMICDPDLYSTRALKQVLGAVEYVLKVESAHTIADARRRLRSGNVNTIFLDPLGLGLDDGSDFIFGIRDVFPDIVFVLYVDMQAVQSKAAAFYAGRRARFGHYFRLDKRTPVMLFEEEVYAVLRAVQFDLPRNGSTEPSTGVPKGGKGSEREEGQSAVSSGDTSLREIFSLNLGNLRTKVASLTADEAIKRTALALIEELSRIDRIGKIDPEAAIGKARAVTESLVTPLYLKHSGEKVKPLFEMIEQLRDLAVLPAKISSLLHTVRVVGNMSVHYRPDALEKITPSDVSLIGMITAQIIEWYIASDLKPAK